MKTIIITAVLLACMTAAAQKNPCNPEGKPYAKLPGDTTITLPHGTQLTFNRCEYFDIRECLELEEAYDIESIRRQNLTTLDRNGNMLLSAGMFCMKLTGDCATKPCFEVPVKVKMPLPSLSGNNCARCERGTFSLYNSSDGFWSDSTNKNFRILDSAGRHWIEFTAYCANTCFNGDCKIDANAGKTKVKVKNIHKLESVVLTSDCPVGVLKYSPLKGRKKVIAKLPCLPGSTMKISASGYDKNGNIVSTQGVLISTLKHSRARRTCKSGEKLGKKTKKGGFYKKYILSL